MAKTTANALNFEFTLRRRGRQKGRFSLPKIDQHAIALSRDTKDL
jgi:hypothetical protein